MSVEQPQRFRRRSTSLLVIAYLLIIGVIAQRLAAATSWTASLMLLGSVQLVLVLLTFAASRAQVASQTAARTRERRASLPLTSP